MTNILRVYTQRFISKCKVTRNVVGLIDYPLKKQANYSTVFKVDASNFCPEHTTEKQVYHIYDHCSSFFLSICSIITLFIQSGLNLTMQNTKTIK